MPSAYTASVADGTITELKPFAMQLARGMGALVMMRDDPWDAPIPERFEPSQYNAERLAEAKAERDRITSMSDAEADAAAKAEAEEFDRYVAERDARQVEQRKRYESMIAKVGAWKGAPEGIREFALSQLRESLDFDCPDLQPLFERRPDENGAAWRAAKLAKLGEIILYHAKEQAEEEHRTESRNLWLAQLRRSLGE